MTRPVSPLDSILSQPRWTPQDARTVLDALDASGLTVAAFAAQHHVQAQRLFAWRRRLAIAPVSAPSVRFVELDARSATTQRTATRYELVLASGEQLRIEGRFEVDAVAQLLALLREAAPC